MINLQTFYGGHCYQNERISSRLGKWKTVEFPALFFLLKHPTKGYILFDTGYSDLFLKETDKFPYSIYKKMTPVGFESSLNASFQLNEMGISPNEVNYVFISHFHADHIAGLKDFEHSTFICSKEGFDFVKNDKGFKALKKAFIPSLLPKDFEERVIFIEDCKKVTSTVSFESNPFDYFNEGYDIFSDNTLIAFDLSGHAKGQYGLFFQTESNETFLVADACWDSLSYREFVLPSKIANIIMYDHKLFSKNLKKLHLFHKQFSSVCIYPSHCHEVKQLSNKGRA